MHACTLSRHRLISANAWNGGSRNNVARAADDANDATISVISSRTAVCDDGGPGNKHYNCQSNGSPNSNCTYLRYLHHTPSTDYNNNTSNYQTTATLDVYSCTLGLHIKHTHLATSTDFMANENVTHWSKSDT